MNAEPKAQAQGDGRSGACKHFKPICFPSDLLQFFRSHEVFHSISTSLFRALLKSCVIPVTLKDHPFSSLFPASNINNSK